MARETMKWFYNSTMWQYIRMKALKRDGFTCVYCGARATEVHHIIELNERNVHDPNTSLNLNNLQSLCHDCHTKVTMVEHGKKKFDCDMEYYFDSDGNIQRFKPPSGR